MSTKNPSKTRAKSPETSVETAPDSLNLALITTLPSGWQSITTSTGPYTNTLILNGIEALEAPAPNYEDTEAWLHRLDAKADLALAHAVLAHTPKPQLKPRAVELYADHLRWHGDTLDGQIEVWLQIHPLAPPLILSASAQGTRAYFIELSSETQEALERLIFRHHRRQIRAQREA